VGVRSPRRESQRVITIAGLLGGYANSIEEITSTLPDPYRGVASS
jgi:hypothetical protein